MPETIRVTLTRVIDGDTVEVMTPGRGLFGKPEKCRVRLYGIDALETSQKGGDKATKHLRRLIGSKRKLWMKTFDTDKYGRTVGLIYEKRNRPDSSYNYMMVRDGQARAYMTRPADRARFQQAEEEAKRRGREIWRRKGQQAPWDYRRKERDSAAKRSRAKITVIIIMAAFGALLYLSLVLTGSNLPWFGLPGLSDLPEIPGGP